MGLPNDIGARWEDEASQAAEQAGYTIVDNDGNCDYQGWGSLLLRMGEQWATLSWFYGSCPGCDSYEDMPTADVIESLKGDIVTHQSEADARLAYTGSKGW